MVLTYTGKFATTVYPSLQLSTGTPVTLQTGNVITCQWTNGLWNIAATPPLAPPADLHVIGR